MCGLKREHSISKLASKKDQERTPHHPHPRSKRTTSHNTPQNKLTQIHRHTHRCSNTFACTCTKMWINKHICYVVCALSCTEDARVCVLRLRVLVLWCVGVWCVFRLSRTPIHLLTHTHTLEQRQTHQTHTLQHITTRTHYEQYMHQHRPTDTTQHKRLMEDNRNKDKKSLEQGEKGEIRRGRVSQRRRLERRRKKNEEQGCTNDHKRKNQQKGRHRRTTNQKNTENTQHQKKHDEHKNTRTYERKVIFSNKMFFDSKVSDTEGDVACHGRCVWLFPTTFGERAILCNHNGQLSARQVILCNLGNSLRKIISCHVLFVQKGSFSCLRGTQQRPLLHRVKKRPAHVQGSQESPQHRSSLGSTTRS